MSVLEIRQALETAIDGLVPHLPTHFENAKKPVVAAGEPFQEGFLRTARPTNDEYGPSHTKLGFYQLTLCYPLLNGPADADQRADFLETAFPRGRTLVAGDTHVVIENTVEIMGGYRDGDAWRLPVRIHFYANIIVPA